jgi:hypothetical protein
VSGVSLCSCSTGDAEFVFDANVSAADRNACLAAVGNCAPEVEVEPSGALACKMVQQSAEPQHCNADLECTQPVTIGGKEYVARGQLLLGCNQEAAGEPWRCTCATQGAMAAIDVEGDRTAWEACTEATTSCQGESGVRLGPPG